MMKRLLPVVVFVLIAGIAGADERCALCGRNLNDTAGWQHFVLTTEDGKKWTVCSESCAGMFRDGSNKEVRAIEAVDYSTGNLTNALTAFYVKGSNVRPPLGGESFVAFADKEAAENFRKEHGGELVSVDELFKPDEDGGHGGHGGSGGNEGHEGHAGHH